MKNYIPIGLFLISILLSVLLLKEYFYVESPPCSSYSNCKDCTDSSSTLNGCAWCANIGKCVERNRMGFPVNNECQDRDMISIPNNCNRPATNDLPFETISDSIAVNPQTGLPYPSGYGGSGSSSGSGSGSGGGSGSGSGSNNESWSRFINNIGLNSNNWLNNSGWDNNNGWGRRDASGNAVDASGNVIRGSFSGSKLIKDAGYQYAGACPDYSIVETRIKTNLDPTIKNILKSELTRSGLTYVEGFGQLETTQTSIQAGVTDDIIQSVRKSICKKTNKESWIGKPKCT